MTFYRRNLPHWCPEGRAIFLTWRLCGSLPEKSRIEIAKFRGNPGRQFLMLDRHLEPATSGPLWLADPEIADCAESSILRGQELHHYELHAYVIMPNHVHLLLEPRVPLRKITNAVKGTSSRNANARRKSTGKHFWQDESFDHWIRNSQEFERLRRYIEWNPVKAKLAARPEDWRWSSAHTPPKKSAPHRGLLP